MYYTAMYMSFSVTVSDDKSIPSIVPSVLSSACSVAIPPFTRESLSIANVCSVLLLPSGPACMIVQSVFIFAITPADRDWETVIQNKHLQ